MIAAHFRAYRSEPPPTAVLMTNSTGLVGCTIVATDAAEPLGVGAVPVLLAQAVRVMSAAARIAVIRIADLDMTRTSMLQVRTAVSKGSHRRSDRDLSCHNGGSGSAWGVRSAGPELVRSRGRARSVGMVQELTRPTSLRRGAAPDTAFAFLDGEFLPVRDAKVSVLTHAFNYGTGVFEGIRAYWNAEEGQLYGLHLKEHYQRLHRSCRIMRIGLPYTAEDLVGITLELLRKCGYREDAYVRPIAYKSSPLIGVRLHDLEDAFTVFAVPFGTYIDIDRGISCGVSSWRRTDDNAIPARSKITGAYVNAALAKTEAQEAGFDEAIVLTQDGHVSEGSAENLFLVRDGTLITPPGTDNILEGITRTCILKIAADSAIPTAIRQVDRTELYVADEVFLCGTGAQISPVTSVDHRAIGKGERGPITAKVSEIYFDAVRGKAAKYRGWVTPVYKR